PECCRPLRYRALHGAPRESAPACAAKRHTPRDGSHSVNALQFATALPAAIVLAHGAWWTLLGLLATSPPRSRSAATRPGFRIAVIVPAHNEERLLPRCLRSLQ